MIPVVFINCSRSPFLDDIISGRKTIETRSRDTLRNLAGMRVLLAETGNGRPVVRCSAALGYGRPVDRSDWECLRSRTRVPEGSAYDWQPDTKVRYCYDLHDVRPCSPFTPPEGVRHGRVWMEYDGTLPPDKPVRTVHMDDLMQNLKRFLEAIGCTDVTILSNDDA